MIVCTIASAKYLHKVKVLANSVKKHLSSAKMVVCLLEKNMHPSAEHVPFFDEVILAKDLNIYQFPSFIFKYNVIEAATAVKSNLLQYLLAKYNEESHFIYLDPDTQVLNSFDDLIRVMDKSSIVLTPHQLETEGFWSSQFNNGIYNLGFLAVTRSEETDRFLSWWSDRLYHYCFYRHPLFVDQKWIDLAVAYFNIHIFKNPGYNISFWNLHEKCRRITSLPSGEYWVRETPLSFMHFSCLDSYFKSSMEWVIPDPQSAIYRLVDDYRKQLEEMGQGEMSKESWSYDFYDSGEWITSESRYKYDKYPELAVKFPNPYLASNDAFVL